MLFFRFDASPKELFLLSCYGISGKYCKQYQYFWVFLDIQIKYSWKSIISLLKYCTLHKTHFALQPIDNHIFFMTSPNRNTVFLDLLAVKYVNLTLWLKVYIASNNLHILKIRIELCKWKISFQITSLRFVKYIEKKPNLTILPSLKSKNFLCQPW